MEALIKIVLAVLIVASTPSTAEFITPELRYLKAYTAADCTGASITFYESVPDLSAYSISDVIKCVCYTGWWVLFSEINYVSSLVSLSNFDTCYQDSTLEIQSLRRVGSSIGLNDDYYNLYQDPAPYQGFQLEGNANLEILGELDQAVSYVAITGQSPWTFYTGQEYTGASVCVYPASTATSAADGRVLNYASSLSTGLGLPDNSIRSLALGCHSTMVAYLEPSQESIQADERGQIISKKH